MSSNGDLHGACRPVGAGMTGWVSAGWLQAANSIFNDSQCLFLFLFVAELTSVLSAQLCQYLL